MGRKLNRHKAALVDVLLALHILNDSDMPPEGVIQWEWDDGEEEDAFFKEYKAWRWESSGDEEWSNFI
jgi:hypothetical protein